MGIVDARKVQPSEIKSGDVMLFIVKAEVIRPGVYQLYRCLLRDGTGVPFGSRIVNEREVCEALFPSLAQVAEPDET